MTLAIAHGEGERAILDLLKEAKAPFSPREIVREFAQLLKSYRSSEVYGDKYSASWVSEAFEREGISYRAAEKNRSELYLEFLPSLTSGQIELLENQRMRDQFAGLQRRTGPGRDSIDHGPGGHDDLANAAAGVLALVRESTSQGQLGVLEFFRTRARDIAAGLRNSMGELLHPKPEPERIRIVPPKVDKPVQVDNFQVWLQTHKSPPCPACQSPCTTYLARNELHCNQCGARNGIAPSKPIVNGICPVEGCGLKMFWSGGGLRCCNHGQVPLAQPIVAGPTFAQLKAMRRSRCG